MCWPVKSTIYKDTEVTYALKRKKPVFIEIDRWEYFVAMHSEWIWFHSFLFTRFCTIFQRYLGGAHGSSNFCCENQIESQLLLFLPQLLAVFV